MCLFTICLYKKCFNKDIIYCGHFHCDYKIKKSICKIHSNNDNLEKNKKYSYRKSY